jgi:hypothetical protein
MINLRRFTLSLIACLSLTASPYIVSAAEITPFATSNQSPLVQIFGLPAADRAIINAPGHGSIALLADIANNFTSHENSHEEIFLDDESYRTTMSLRYGVANKVEAGIDIPFVGHGAGVFDSFIEGWHDFFNLPQGSRKQYPRNRLLDTYSKDGRELLRLDDSNFGIGDIRLLGGVQLYNSNQPNPRAVALRGSLKLPTGNSNRLQGSGSTDLALWLTASDDHILTDNWGNVTLFGAVGGMALTTGNVLRDQQRNLVGFGSIGCGWSPTEWIAFKLEIPWHTSFYQNSQLKELNGGSVMLIIGGTLYFPGRTSLDIGVSEDIAVSSAPDVALHLALTHRF